MIDWDRVRELKDEIGEEDFTEVVTLFLEEVEEVIARLRAAPDPARLEEDMHFLKSSALNLGFSELGTLCAKGERQAAQGQADTINLAPVFDCFDASKAVFAAG